MSRSVKNPRFDKATTARATAAKTSAPQLLATNLSSMGQRQLYVWDRLVLQLASGIKNGRHRHFGAFLLIAPDAPFEVHIEPSRRIVGQAVLVAPNTWHSLDTRNSRVTTLLVGADHEWFGHVGPALRGAPAVSLELSKLTDPKLNWDRLFEGKEKCDAVHRFVERALSSMTDNEFTPHILDPRIAAAVTLLNREQGHALSPAALGRQVGLSAVTLMRKFKRELGVRIREYVLWRRLLSTIALANGQRTLTEIAHLAGFYDQAHLTRTARRMFDVQPSNALMANRARIHVCKSDGDRRSG